MLSPCTILMIQGAANVALSLCIRPKPLLIDGLCTSPPSVGQSIDVHGCGSQDPLKVSHALAEGAHAPQAHASVPDIGCVGRLHGNGLFQVSKSFLVLPQVLQDHAPAHTAYTSVKSSDDKATVGHLGARCSIVHTMRKDCVDIGAAEPVLQQLLYRLMPESVSAALSQCSCSMSLVVVGSICCGRQAMGAV